MTAFIIGTAFGAAIVYIATNPTLRAKLSSLLSGWIGEKG